MLFLQRVFGHFPPEAPLLGLTTNLFRRRWDSLLLALGFPAGAFTPAGMRGGGAVAFFRQHRDIPSLMWQMRVGDQSTLAHYLQEVTAQISLVHEAPLTRAKVRSAAAMYEVILAMNPAT